MRNFIKSLRSTRYADNDDMKQFFGLKVTQKWPDKGMIQRRIQGVLVYVTPAPPKQPRPAGVFGRKPGFWKSSKHRCMIICEGCGVHFSAGRKHQHKCKEVKSG